MKKAIILFITAVFIIIVSCSKRGVDSIELIVKGDFPTEGKAIVHLYGYDKNIPDDSTTLMSIKKVDVNKNPLKLELEFPKDSYKVINSNYSNKDDIEFFITVDLDINEDEDVDYTQDFGHETLLRVFPGVKKEVLVKKI
ncbi:hypothetical protein [uncultured Ilyobacter sp.]|uniref:hypothetical protein n=1 Tax=uncultured Ilyobacter sp. TaxID=544433 RepID=UPI0029C72DAD|nr:hypothetical protein [uncultured Ilyobacter sp.]